MCGIAGIISRSGVRDVRHVLEGMVDSLRRRGPDDSGLEIVRCGSWDIGLGHTRLAILDLSDAGHQPMMWEGERLVLTYNGELYNFRELSSEIDPVEQDWRSRTDTEVIGRGFLKWGRDAFDRFRGMFALGLWDGKREELILARDTFGIKPLYYYKGRDFFIFASEVRTLLQTGLIPKSLDSDGIASFLQYGSLQSPRTLIEGIRSVEAGCCMSVGLKEGIEVVERRFDKVWVPAFAGMRLDGGDGRQDYRESVTRLRGILKESVRLHLVSDVPVGVFLSGGVDSSVIVALMSEASDQPPKTFTIAFREEQYSEACQARLIAEKFKTDHTEIVLPGDDLSAMLPLALEAMDQPTMDGINTYVVSKAVKDRGITVALSGLGGDELFAGYPSFKRAHQLRTLSKCPRWVRSALALALRRMGNGNISFQKARAMIECNGTALDAYRISRRLFGDGEIRDLWREVQGTGVRSREDLTGDHLRDVSVLEMTGYMKDTLLRDTDFMSMDHAQEIRVPFLDVNVAHFVLNLPSEWKMKGRRPKALLLDAMDGLLPREVWARPKKGFVFPFKEWMKTSLKKQVDESFADKSACEAVGLQQDRVLPLWQAFQRDTRGQYWSRLWALYVLVRWWGRYGR